MKRNRRRIIVGREDKSALNNEGYYKGELLWLSLLTQLKKGFEELGKLCDVKFPLIYSSLSVSEMRNTVLKYLPLYASLIEHTCYIFIDGLDHAARSKDVRNSLLYQLPHPDEVGEQVKFVLVSQPANENFPIWIKNNSEIEYVSLPLLDVATGCNRTQDRHSRENRPLKKGIQTGGK